MTIYLFAMKMVYSSGYILLPSATKINTIFPRVHDLEIVKHLVFFLMLLELAAFYGMFFMLVFFNPPSLCFHTFSPASCSQLRFAMAKKQVIKTNIHNGLHEQQKRLSVRVTA